VVAIAMRRRIQASVESRDVSILIVFENECSLPMSAMSTHRDTD